MDTKSYRFNVIYKVKGNDAEFGKNMVVYVPADYDEDESIHACYRTARKTILDMRAPVSMYRIDIIPGLFGMRTGWESISDF